MAQIHERPIQILCCDDDSSIREFLSIILGTVVSAEVTTCSNGIEAMKLLSNNYYDLIISDFDMRVANGSGLDLFQFIQNQKITTPFYLFTSDFYLNFDQYTSFENFKYIDKLKFEDLLSEVKSFCAKQLN